MLKNFMNKFAGINPEPAECQITRSETTCGYYCSTFNNYSSSKTVKYDAYLGTVCSTTTHNCQCPY